MSGQAFSPLRVISLNCLTPRFNLILLSRFVVTSHGLDVIPQSRPNCIQQFLYSSFNAQHSAR